MIFFHNYKFYLAILFIFIYGCSDYKTKLVNKELPSKLLSDNWDKYKATTYDFNKAIPNWILQLGDGNLNLLILKALDNNADLNMIKANLKNAQAIYEQSNANTNPRLSVDLKKQYTENYNSKTYSNSNSLGLSLNWELDFWNKLSDDEKTSYYELKEVAQTLKHAKLSLAANVAKRYLEIIKQQQLFKIAKDYLQNIKINLELKNKQFDNGLASSEDLQQLKASFYQKQVELANRELTLSNAVRALKILIGDYPDDNLVIKNINLPLLTNDITPSIPAEVVFRRADILSAKAAMGANEYNISSAVKNRLPSFNLSASYGTSSEHFYNILDANYLIASAIAAISADLFDNGVKKANIEKAKANYEKSYWNYINTIISAYNEIEQYLQSEENLKNRFNYLKAENEERKILFEIIKSKYTLGVSDYQTYLTNEKNYFNSKDSLTNIKYLLLENRVNLHLALGGDFINF